VNDLGEFVAWLYPDLLFGRDYRVEQGSDGVQRIAFWGAAGTPHPTAEYLQSKRAEFDARNLNWRQRRDAKTLAGGGKPDLVLLRAILRTVMMSIAQDRAYMDTLRRELVALGRTLPAAPAVRTWEQLMQAVANAIDQGDGDLPASAQSLSPGGGK